MVHSASFNVIVEFGVDKFVEFLKSISPGGILRDEAFNSLLEAGFYLPDVPSPGGVWKVKGLSFTSRSRRYTATHYDIEGDNLVECADVVRGSIRVRVKMSVVWIPCYKI